MNTGRFVDPEDVKKLCEKGYNDYRIARELGFGKITILNCRRKLGLPAISGVGRPHDDTKYWDLYQQGYNDLQIAKKVGLTQGGIFLWRKRNGLPPQNMRASKVDKIVKEMSDSITELYSQGYSDLRISRELNIPTYAVERWRVREELPEALFDSKEVDYAVAPLRDEESLYCDTEFLENFLNKKLERKDIPTN